MEAGLQVLLNKQADGQHLRYYGGKVKTDCRFEVRGARKNTDNRSFHALKEQNQCTRLPQP
ncbi:MAG: hypothetical protein FWF54_06535 [Candidatus Azobacteroides sp.]|nr:hypothetical protein [Candidatus Azobacteroides sp.]